MKRWRLIFTLTLSAIVFATAHSLPQLFLGNISLNASLRASNETRSRGKQAGLPTQRGTARFLLERTFWNSRDYAGLLGMVQRETGTELRGARPIQRQLANHYRMVARRLHEGVFPPRKTWPRELMTSAFITRQSQLCSDSENKDLAQALREFAYLVDSCWKDEEERAGISFRQGEDYRRMGKLNAASVAYTRALQTCQTRNTDRCTALVAWCLAGLGDVNARLGNSQKAVAYYRESILKRPASCRVTVPAFIRALRQTPGFARQDLVPALRGLRSENGLADPYLTAWPALALLDLGETESAWSHFLAGWEANRDHPAVIGCHAALLDALGDVASARELYARAIKSAPSPYELAFWAGRLSDLESRAGNKQAATQDMELAVRHEAENYYYWYRLGLKYREQGRLPDADSAFQRGLALKPNDETLLKAMRLAAPSH